MKKTFFAITLAAGMLTFGSCSTTEERTTETEEVEGVEGVEGEMEEAGDEIEEGAEEVEGEVDDNDA